MPNLEVELSCSPWLGFAKVVSFVDFPVPLSFALQKLCILYLLGANAGCRKPCLFMFSWEVKAAVFGKSYCWSLLLRKRTSDCAARVFYRCGALETDMGNGPIWCLTFQDKTQHCFVKRAHDRSLCMQTCASIASKAVGAWIGKHGCDLFPYPKRILECPHRTPIFVFKKGPERAWTLSVLIFLLLLPYALCRTPLLFVYLGLT